jgi:transketolase C-terminal domain/subunit
MDYLPINEVFGESAHHAEELQAAFGLTADNIALKARKLATGKP